MIWKSLKTVSRLVGPRHDWNTSTTVSVITFLTVHTKIIATVPLQRTASICFHHKALPLYRFCIAISQFVCMYVIPVTINALYEVHFQYLLLVLQCHTVKFTSSFSAVEVSSSHLAYALYPLSSCKACIQRILQQ